MKIHTKQLVETAVLLAVGTVLSLVKLDMPMGGGLTLCSMLPLVLISWRYGARWGGVSGLLYGVLQLMLGLDNVRYASGFWMAMGIVMLDYILAYGVIGLSGLFRGRGKARSMLAAGIAFTFVLRFVCHFITGVWIWDALWPNEFGMASVWYSAAYNGWYMGGELVLTEVAALACYKPLRKYFEGQA